MYWTCSWGLFWTGLSHGFTYLLQLFVHEHNVLVANLTRNEESIFLPLVQTFILYTNLFVNIPLLFARASEDRLRIGRICLEVCKDILHEASLCLNFYFEPYSDWRPGKLKEHWSKLMNLQMAQQLLQSRSCLAFGIWLLSS